MGVTGDYRWLGGVAGDSRFKVKPNITDKHTNILTPRWQTHTHLDHHWYSHCRQVIIIFLMTTRVVLTRSPYVLGPYLETCYRRRAEPRARKQISGPSPFIISCYYNSWDILQLRLRQAQASLFDLQLIATNNNYDYKLIWVNSATYWSVGFSQELATLGF